MYSSTGGLGKITVDGTITEYHPAGFPAITDLAAGPDGNIWFTDRAASKIGKITPAGVTTTYSASLACCPQPMGIAAGADGNLWFTEVWGNGFSGIGKISITGSLTEFPPVQMDLGLGLIAGSDGNIWFGGGKIAPDGTITQFGDVGTEIAEGPDRNIWFANGRVGRMTLHGAVTTYPLPAANSSALGVAIGSDGNVWFTDQGVNSIGKLVLPAPAGSLAQIASGGGWDTNLTLVNLGPAAAQASLSFFSDLGVPLTLPLTFPDGSTTTTSSVVEKLNPDAVAVLDSTSDKAAVDVGWAVLQGGGNVSGVATFSDPASNWAAAVPLENRNAEAYELVFDNTSAVSTGVAIANLTSETIEVFVALRDDGGNGIGSDTITLMPEGHASFMLDQQYAATAGKRGTIEFYPPAAGQISILGLRVNGGALTTLPALPLKVSSLANAVPVTGSFAHVTYDGGFTSSFYLFNPTPITGQFTLSFFDESGKPLAVPLSLPQSGTSLTTSVLTRFIPARSILFIETVSSDANPSTVASAQLTSNTGIGGFEIFRWTPFGQEASVALAAGESDTFVLVADNTNGAGMGVALANTTDSPLTVLFKQRDDSGALLQTDTIDLPEHGHISFMLPDRYPAVAGMHGTAEFSAPAPGKVSVIGLEIKPNGTLTTIPTLAK
jgi:streptogramin lyase